ncbi:KAP family P-loop NTPase fold protein [Sessilibacter sp. MAH4]
MDDNEIKIALSRIANVNVERLVAISTRQAFRLYPFIFDESGSTHFMGRNEEFTQILWRTLWLSLCFKKSLLNDNDYLTQLSGTIGIGRNAMGNNRNRYAATAADVISSNGRVIDFINYNDKYEHSVTQADNAFSRAVRGDHLPSDFSKYYKIAFIDDIQKSQNLERLYTYPLWNFEVKGTYEIQKSLMYKYFTERKLDLETEILKKLFSGFDYSDYLNLNWKKLEERRDYFSKRDYPKVEKYKPGTQFTSEVASNQDHLNREPIAKALANWLMDKANKNHITIGLFGDWGMGKSTFVELIKKQLILANNVKQTRQKTDDTQFIVAEFNAWKYERSSNIQAGLAHEVVGGLLKGLPWYLKWVLTFKYIWAKHKIKLICLFVVLVAILIFGFVASQQISGEEKIILWGIDIAAIALIVRDQGKKLLAHPLAKDFKTYLRLPHFGEHLGTIPVMREQLETLIKLRLEHSHRDMHAGFFYAKKLDNQRFLLVVDDLDRCSHEGVVKTFEAVRLVMDLPNVIVIIAIDQRIALASLALHYQDISKHHQADPIGIARDYLGKVIHLPITLEEPAADDVEKFLRNEWQKVGDVKSNKELQDIESIIKPKVINGSIGDSNGQPITNNTTQSNEDSGNSNSDNLENYGSDKPENIKSKPDLPLEKQAENHQETPPEDLQIIESSYQKGLSKQQEKLFIEWVKRLNISNPRRLKRLTNAYALIRHCFVAEDDVEKSQEDQKPYSRLVMLIWLEYVNELNRNQRAQVLEVFKLKDIPELKLEKINENIKQYLTEVRDYVGMENIELIYNQVKNFVLPAIDGVDQVVATPDSMSW